MVSNHFKDTVWERCYSNTLDIYMGGERYVITSALPEQMFNENLEK